MGYHKIARLDPQPDEYGIFSTGFIRINDLDKEGREIYDPNRHLKPSTTDEVVGGVWLAECHKDDDLACITLKQGRFSICPIKNLTWEQFLNDEISAGKYSDGWYWTKKE